jgi:hypothetical protein
MKHGDDEVEVKDIVERLITDTTNLRLTKIDCQTLVVIPTGSMV